MKLMLLAFSAASAFPLADIFVDAQGTNCASATGTAGDPACSINDGLALASPGDTIRIAPGTYVENLALNSDIELIGTGGADVTIVDGSLTGSVITIASAVTVTIDGLTLSNGSAASGGGIMTDGILTLSNSTISGNRAGPFGGGGISVRWEGSATVTNCSIENNYSASEGGGMTTLLYATCLVRNTTIRDNTAGTNGGGFAHTVSSGMSRLENCTISGNQTLQGHGGGAHSSSQTYFPTANGALFMESCTVTDNFAGNGSGGGLFQGGGGSLGGFPIYISNSIVVGNGAQILGYGNNEDVDGDSGVFFFLSQLGYNISSSGSLLAGQTAGIAAVASDVLEPLQDNGGKGWTHALRPHSVAVDSGSSTLLFDQRGIVRPTGSGVDRGAYEAFPEFCFGDGGTTSGCTSCPCNNDASSGSFGGCLNSQGASARLSVRGRGSVADDTLRVGMTGGTANSFAILTAGANLAPANAANPCFGENSGLAQSNLDGLRCTVGDVRRLGTRMMDAAGSVGITNNTWGNPGSSLIQLGALTSGQTRHFQAVYRDEPALGCMTGLNTTQSVSVTFQP